MAETTSTLLVNRLIDWGVEVIFGIPGDGINGVFDALREKQDFIKFVQVRHEEAAAFAACAYAKFTGRLGVCIATSGPGGIHLLNGLYDATMDGQPVLAITGHTFHDLIGTRQQQDVALDKLFDDVAVFSERITGPSHVENALDEGIRLAYSRRAVAHINIPKDVQTWEANSDHSSKLNVPGHSGISRPRLPLPNEDELDRAAGVLNQGKKIVILAGQGAIHAREEVLQVAELLGAVIIKPLLGKAAVPDDSPYTTGGIGLLGTKPSEDAMNDCDTLFIIGSSFPYESHYPKPGQARGVQIEIDPARIGLRFPVEAPLAGDSKQVRQALIPKLARKDDREFLSIAQKGVEEWWKLMDERASSDSVPTKPQVVPHLFNELLEDDAIVVADSGTAPSWLARQWKIRGDQ